MWTPRRRTYNSLVSCMETVGTTGTVGEAMFSKHAYVPVCVYVCVMIRL